jgi:hypothetical protein
MPKKGPSQQKILTRSIIAVYTILCAQGGLSWEQRTEKLSGVCLVCPDSGKDFSQAIIDDRGPMFNFEETRRNTAIEDRQNICGIEIIAITVLPKLEILHCIVIADILHHAAK